MSESITDERSEIDQTTVDVKATGLVRRALPEHRFSFTFDGDTLRAFLESFFDEFEVEELLIAETEADATAHGWAKPPERLPGTWTKNPEGEQTCAYVRICVNGRFNENLNGFDTELNDGDRVALMYPFMFCC